MKQPNPLFLLIRSMSGQEKRYFKLFSKLYKGDKHYIKLFDAIESQGENYDERKLRRSLKKEKWLSYFPKVKNHLYNAILKSLEVYGLENSEDGELQKAKILFGKGLYKGSDKLIRKLKIRFEEDQNFVALLEVLLLERHTNTLLYFEKKSQKDIEELSRKIQDVTRIIDNIAAQQAICDQLHFLINKFSYVRTQGQLNEAKKIFSNTLLENEKCAFSTRALYVFYFSHVFFYGFMGDYKNVCKYSVKQLKLMKYPKENPLYNFSGYLSALTNYLQAAILCKQYDTMFQKYFSELERFYLDPALSDRDADIQIKTRLFVRFYMIRFLYLINSGQHNKITAMLPAFLSQLEIYKSSMAEVSVSDFNYFIALYNFGIGNYLQAYNYLNTFLTAGNAPGEETQAAKLLQMFAVFELNDDTMIEQSVKSVYRYLKTRKLFRKFEQAMMLFIKHSIRHYSDSEKMKGLYLQLKVNLEKIKNDPFEKRAFEGFDYILWVESKIKNRPFAEVAREKVKAINE